MVVGTEEGGDEEEGGAEEEDDEEEDDEEEDDDEEDDEEEDDEEEDDEEADDEEADDDDDDNKGEKTEDTDVNSILATFFVESVVPLALDSFRFLFPFFSLVGCSNGLTLEIETNDHE